MADGRTETRRVESDPPGVEWPLVGVDCPWFGSDLGGWLVGRRRVMDGAEAVWLAGLAAFDREGGWAADGQLSCAAWLMWRAGMARATAFERVRVARELDGRPVLSRALAEGRVSYCAVRAMLRAVGASPGVDRALVTVAEAGSVADVELAVRTYRLHADQDRRPDDRGVPRGVRIRRLGEGMVRVEAVLTELEGAELEAVLRAMLDRDPTDPTEGTDPTDPTDDTDDVGTGGGAQPGEESARADCPTDDADPATTGDPDSSEGPGAGNGSEPVTESARADCPADHPDPAGPGPEQQSWAERRADALMTAVRSALGSLPAPAADRYTVHVVVRHDRACLLGADPLAEQEWQRISCDCGTVIHHHDPDGRPLALGRRQRTWSTAQRRAITVRDGGRCRWPGCTNTHADIHHVRPWSQGGTTDTSNGVLLCPGHHTRIHQGFGAHGAADGRLHFTRPDGTPLGATAATTTDPATPPAPPGRGSVACAP